MRAVVTQIQGKFAAILSEDGRIEKITNKNYVIGQVIEMKENVKAKKHKHNTNKIIIDTNLLQENVDSIFRYAIYCPNATAIKKLAISTIAKFVPIIPVYV